MYDESDIEWLKKQRQDSFERWKRIGFEIDEIESDLVPLRIEEEELKEEIEGYTKELKEIEERGIEKLNMIEKAIMDKNQMKLS